MNNVVLNTGWAFNFYAVRAHGIPGAGILDRKSTRLNSSHANISYAVFFLKKTKTLRPSVAPARKPATNNRVDATPLYDTSPTLISTLATPHRTELLIKRRVTYKDLIYCRG